jgi:uncharacterized protein YlzI (FlbEa/FlbD family)
MYFIDLTRQDGAGLIVNAANITYIEGKKVDGTEHSVVFLTNGESITVTQNAASVRGLAVIARRKAEKEA